MDPIIYVIVIMSILTSVAVLSILKSYNDRIKRENEKIKIVINERFKTAIERIKEEDKHRKSS